MGGNLLNLKLNDWLGKILSTISLLPMLTHEPLLILKCWDKYSMRTYFLGSCTLVPPRHNFVFHVLAAILMVF